MVLSRVRLRSTSKLPASGFAQTFCSCSTVSKVLLKQLAHSASGWCASVVCKSTSNCQELELVPG